MNVKKIVISLSLLALSFSVSQCFAGYALEIESEKLLLEEEAAAKADKSYDFRETLRRSQIVLGSQNKPPVKASYKSTNNRYYTRLEASLIAGGTAAHFRIKERGVNTSLNAASQYAVIKKAARGILAHRGAAFGYQWKSKALELEYVGTGKLAYNNAPPLTITNSSIDATLAAYSLKTGIFAKAILINILSLSEQKSLVPWLQVRPYWQYGFGYGQTKSNTITSNSTVSSSANKTRRSFALDAGIGSRVRLTENFFLDTNVRGYLWPKASVPVQYAAQSASVFLEPKIFVSASWFLGLTFLF
jgi:hypothetical protein